jgi:hypothetical protein
LSKIIDFYFCTLLRVDSFYEVACSFDKPDSENTIDDEVEIEINGINFGTVQIKI